MESNYGNWDETTGDYIPTETKFTMKIIKANWTTIKTVYYSTQ